MTLASLRPGDYRIDGAKTQDGAGWSVATSPDLNDDGIGDVLLGAPGVDRPSGPTLAPAPNSVGPQESIGAAYVVYGSKTPANVNVGSIDRQGPAAHGRRRLPLGRPGRLERRRASATSPNNGVNVAAVGIPGWDSNQQTPRRHRPRPRPRAAAQRRRRPIAPTISITSPVDGARIPVGTAGQPRVLLR